MFLFFEDLNEKLMKKNVYERKMNDEVAHSADFVFFLIAFFNGGGDVLFFSFQLFSFGEVLKREVYGEFSAAILGGESSSHSSNDCRIYFFLFLYCWQSHHFLMTAFSFTDQKKWIYMSLYFFFCTLIE